MRWKFWKKISCYFYLARQDARTPRIYLGSEESLRPRLQHTCAIATDPPRYYESQTAPRVASLEQQSATGRAPPPPAQHDSALTRPRGPANKLDHQVALDDPSDELKRSSNVSENATTCAPT